jgi:hypothetical protein
MTVKEIVKTYLKKNKYDGLYSATGLCGCEMDDLFPCDNNFDDCKPGFKKFCVADEDCKYCLIDCYGFDAEKPNNNWRIEKKRKGKK